jgi:NADH-quinone oxidoreductase subunit A
VIADYAGVLVLLACALVLTGALLLVPRFAARGEPKREERESVGAQAEAPAPSRRRLAADFHALAILFLIFGLGVVFFYPFSVTFRELGSPGLVAMGLFALPLVVGLIYGWSRGALEW